MSLTSGPFPKWCSGWENFRPSAIRKLILPAKKEKKVTNTDLHYVKAIIWSWWLCNQVVSLIQQVNIISLAESCCRELTVLGSDDKSCSARRRHENLLWSFINHLHVFNPFIRHAGSEESIKEVKLLIKFYEVPNYDLYAYNRKIHVLVWCQLLEEKRQIWATCLGLKGKNHCYSSLQRGSSQITFLLNELFGNFWFKKLNASSIFRMVEQQKKWKSFFSQFFRILERDLSD